MAEEIKIVASAVGFDQVDKALNTTAKGFNEVNVAAKKTGDTLSKEMKNGSAQAGQSLQNLSRIAQDAPYGFIGIANNINPLIESFQRLKMETGSTGGAFKALVSGLTGPMGVCLAVGVISSLLVVFSSSAGKAKDELDPLVKANEEFKKSLDGARSSALSSGLQLQTFVNIAKDSRLPLEQRNEALKQANDIMGKHGEVLTLTSVATEKATQEVNLYTQAIIAQAVATKYADKLADLQIQKTNKLNELSKARLAVLESVKRMSDETNAGYATEEYTSGQATVSLGIYQQAMQKVATIKSELNQIDTDFNQTQINLNNTILQSTSAFGQLGYKAKDTKEKVKKVKEEIMKLTAFSPKKLELFSTDLGKMSAKERLAKFKQDLGVIEIPIMPVIDINGLPLPVKKGLIDLTTSLNSFMTEAAMSIGTGFADVLSTAIQGGNLGNAFAGIFASMAGLVEELGKQMIQIGITALIAKKALASVLANPYLAIAAGVALATLGSLIKSTVGQKSSFAVGTRNAPGGMALVGERGPELINLPKGSQVIPAAQTSNMMGAMSSIEVFGMLKGKDIYFSNKKYSNTYSTTT